MQEKTTRPVRHSEQTEAQEQPREKHHEQKPLAKRKEEETSIR